MLCIDFEGIEASASALIKLTEEFNELKSVRMYIRAQRVDTDIHRMTDNENDDEHDNAQNSVSEYGAYEVEYLSDDAGRHT